MDAPRAEAPPPNAPTPALKISGLRLSYGESEALKGIDLEIEQGEFVAVLGPSGCGKTSLLRSVAGFVQPQEGTIFLRGRDVRLMPPRQRNIGLFFQNYALFPHMSALENVCFGLECRKLPKKQALNSAREALALVGLEMYADRRPRQLSGGQQQRVALARAIVIHPDLLLLDEPLGALDKQLRLQMQMELKSLQKRVGIPALFVTHDQEEAMAMADRIVIMRDGAIEQIDTPPNIFGRPRTAWVGNFIGSGNVIEGEIERDAQGGAQLRVGERLVLPLESQGLGRASGRARFFVRCERLTIEGVASDDDRDGLSIVGKRYLGNSVEVVLDHGQGQIRALIAPEQAETLPPGSRATVAIRPADMQIFDSDSFLGSPLATGATAPH